MNKCNFCKFQRIKREARKNGKHAVLSKRGANFGLGGSRVYILPKGIRLASVSDADLRKFDSGTWFMVVGGYCEC